MKSITIVLVFFLLGCKSYNNNTNKKDKQNRDSIYNEEQAQKMQEYLDEEYNIYLEELRENQNQDIENDPR